MADLAVYYRDVKYGLKKDENEFLRLAQKAAYGTSSKAKYELGVYYKSKNKKDEAVKWYKDCADYYYKLFGMNHEDAIRDLKQLGVNYDPANQKADAKKEVVKKDNADDSAVKDGKVLLYDRSGEVLQSATLMEKNGATHVKVDNGLYKLKPCNLRVNGVTYNYSVFLFDRDYYVKGSIPGFKSGSSPAKRSSATTTKRSSSATHEKNKSSEKSGESSITDEIGKEIKKEVEKEVNEKVDKGLKKLKKLF
jgi:hypothetical protein